MKYNRLELLLLHHEYCDINFQPLKDKGIYCISSTTFCVYGKRWSVKALQQLTEDIVNHRIQVETVSEFYGETPYDYFNDHTFYENIMVFEFIFIPRGEEHLFITYETDCKVISIGTLENKKLLSIAETKTAIIDNEEFKRISNLEEVATWEYNPDNFFNGFAIYSFSSEHFKAKTEKGIRSEYKRLAKKYHPDVGGDELMFRALTRSRDYLIGNLTGEHMKASTKKLQGKAV